jgi:hypothetical protein
VAGKTWERTRFPGIYRNEGPRGVRYKVVFGDSEGQQRTKNFRSLKEAKAFQGDIRLKKSQSVRIDPAPGRVNVEEFWKHFLKDSGHPPKHASAGTGLTDASTSCRPGKEAASVRDDGRHQGDPCRHPRGGQERGNPPRGQAAGSQAVRRRCGGGPSPEEPRLRRRDREG